MSEELNELNLKLKIKVECKKEEIEEVERRLLDLIIADVKKMEGLLTTSWLPWKKSYYFSVREVSGDKIKEEGEVN